MILNFYRDELERNRAKILEINTFLDTIADNLVNLREEVRDELHNEGR